MDYMLVRKRDRENVLDVKVIPNEECITQHKLMVCQMNINDAVRKVKTRHVSKCKVWRLKEDDARTKFRDKVQEKYDAGVNMVTSADDI